MTEDVLIDAFASWYSHQYEGQAEEVREFLRELKAKAWDEGHSWGWSDAQDAHDVRQEMSRQDWPLCTPNPYRGGR